MSIASEKSHVKVCIHTVKQRQRSRQRWWKWCEAASGEVMCVCVSTKSSANCKSHLFCHFQPQKNLMQTVSHSLFLSWEVQGDTFFCYMEWNFFLSFFPTISHIWIHTFFVSTVSMPPLPTALPLIAIWIHHPARRPADKPNSLDHYTFKFCSCTSETTQQETQIVLMLLNMFNDFPNQ